MSRRWLWQIATVLLANVLFAQEPSPPLVSSKLLHGQTVPTERTPCHAIRLRSSLSDVYMDDIEAALQKRTDFVGSGLVLLPHYSFDPADVTVTLHSDSYAPGVPGGVLHFAYHASARYERTGSERRVSAEYMDPNGADGIASTVIDVVHNLCTVVRATAPAPPAPLKVWRPLHPTWHTFDPPGVPGVRTLEAVRSLHIQVPAVGIFPSTVLGALRRQPGFAELGVECSSEGAAASGPPDMVLQVTGTGQLVWGYQLIVSGHSSPLLEGAIVAFKADRAADLIAHNIAEIFRIAKDKPRHGKQSSGALNDSEWSVRAFFADVPVTYDETLALKTADGVVSVGRRGDSPLYVIRNTDLLSAEIDRDALQRFVLPSNRRAYRYLESSPISQGPLGELIVDGLTGAYAVANSLASQPQREETYLDLAWHEGSVIRILVLRVSASQANAIERALRERIPDQ